MKCEVCEAFILLPSWFTAPYLDYKAGQLPSLPYLGNIAGMLLV